MIFPKVTKRFGRLASKDRLTKVTVKVVGAALIAAGLAIGGAGKPMANTPAIETPAAASIVGRVITLPTAPALSITDGTTLMAVHYSHSSHASHASHASHCSSASYCN